MLNIWKTFFLQVLDKHAPMRVKRLRKRGNAPWVNSEVKQKLFKRDAFKNKAIKTNQEVDWKLYRCSRNVADAAMRSAKNNYYS